MIVQGGLLLYEELYIHGIVPHDDISCVRWIKCFRWLPLLGRPQETRRSKDGNGVIGGRS